MNLKNMNDNIIARRWKERYSSLEDDIKAKVEGLDASKPKEYLFKKLKSEKEYPDVGTVFELITPQNIVLNGVVVNNHIDSILGQDLLTVIILKPYTDFIDNQELDCIANMFIPPVIISTELWKKGYARNVGRVKVLLTEEYSFYDVVFGKFFKDNGEPYIEKEIIGTYGIATIYGISKMVQNELIIQKMI